MTEIVGGPDIYVDRLSTLQLTCRVTSGDNTPAFIIWQKEDKVPPNKLVKGTRATFKAPLITAVFQNKA